MTNFEISGDSLTGGSDDSHNEMMMNRIQRLEEFAKSIGKSLGMTSLDRGFICTESDSYGFRFAASSEEKFDAKAIEIKEKLSPSQLVEKLG